MKILMFLENDRESFLMDARVKKEAVSLANAGHEMTILLFDKDLAAEELVIDGVRIRILGLEHHSKRPDWNGRQGRIYHMATNKRFGKLMAPVLRVAEVLGFRKIGNGFKALPIALTVEADIYHAHDYATLWLAAFCSDFHGKRFVYDSHELWSDCWIRGRFQRRIIKIVESVLLPKSYKTITINESIADIIARTYNIEKPIVVANFPKYQPPILDFVLRNTLNIANEKSIVIYAGGIKDDRGISNILQSAKQLPDVMFVMMGQGKLNADYPKLKNLHVIAPVLQSEVVRWLSSATVGIHPMLNTEPNQYYSLGNKVGDYVMAGLPIAVSDFPEMRRIAVEDALGVVFDPAEPKDVVRALSELLEPENYAQKKMNIIKKRKNYCWENEEPKLLEIYAKPEVV